MIEVELFDGTVLEFPEGTSPDAIDRVAKSETATRRQGAAPAPADEEQGLLDTIMDYGMSGARRVGYMGQEAARGVTQMLGAPVDLVNVSPMALNLLPGVSGVQPFSEKPFLGSEMLWDTVTAPRDALADVAGFEGGDGQPQDRFDRIAGRVSQEMGAAALPVAGFIGAAGRTGVEGARAMQQSARPISRFTGRMLESAAVNPGRFAAKEGAYAAAAGTGAGIAREVAPEGYEDVADFAGALTGAGALGVGSAVARTGTDAYRAVTGRGGSALVRDEVAGQLGRAAGAPLAPSGAIDTSGLAQVLRSGRNVDAVIPGFRPTTADVTQNPGIAALEYGRSSGGPNAGLYAQRRADNQTAATDAINELRPDATPGSFSSELAARREDNFRAVDQSAQRNVAQANEVFETAMRNLEDLEAQRITAAETRATDATRAAEDATGRLRPTTTAEARGQAVRAALEEAESAARAVERAAWSGVRGEADPSEVAARIQAVTDGLPLARRDAVADLGETLSIPNRLLPEDDIAAAATDAVAVPLEEITSMRSRLTTAQRQASAAGDVDKSEIIGRYVDAVDDYLGTLDIGEALENARAVSRDLNDRFTRRGTPIADALATRPSGGPARPDSEVARSFVRPDEGQASVVQDVIRETGDAPPVRSALADQIRAETQGLAPDQIEQYAQQRRTVMQLFPDLQADLDAAAKAGREARDAERGLATESRAAAADRAAGTRDAERQLRDTTQAEVRRVEDTRAALYEGRGDDPRAMVGKYLTFGDERAADAMASITASRDPAKAVDDLLNFVDGNPQAVEGARAAFWSLMERRTRSSGVSTRSPGGEQPFKFQQLDNFLSDPANRAVAERLYRDNPEHLENLGLIAGELRAVNFGQTGRAPNTSGTPQGLRGSDVLPSTETLASRGFAYQRGQVGGAYLGLSLASVMARRATLKGRNTEFQSLLDKALLDPEFAATLAAENNPANLAAMSRAAKVHLGVRSGWLDDLVMDDEEPSLEDAVMRVDVPTGVDTSGAGWVTGPDGRPTPAPGYRWDEELERLIME